MQYGSTVLQYIAIYCNILFALLFHPYKLISLYNVALHGCRKATKKEKKKTEEEKEDEALARDIAKLQIKAYKHFLNVMLM